MKFQLEESSSTTYDVHQDWFRRESNKKACWCVAIRPIAVYSFQLNVQAQYAICQLAGF